MSLSAATPTRIPDQDPPDTPGPDLALAQRTLDRTKIRLMSRPDSVFIATVCFSLRHVFTHDVPTAATDGRHVLYNPDFWMGLDSDAQLGLMLHETWHVVFDHCSALAGSRLGDRDPKLFNIAADHVINLVLLDAGYTLPAGGLHDARFANLSTEQVYRILEAEAPPVPPDFPMDLRPPTGDEKERKGELEDILVKAALQADLQGNGAGSLPGEIQVTLSRLTDPKLPWDALLSRFFSKMAKSDYSFRRPNRRFFPEHYLPSAYAEAIGHVGMAIDMSGSVSDAETAQFISDVSYVITRLRLGKLELVQFDVRVRSVTEITSAQDLTRVDFVGRGGTRIEPVLTWAKDTRPDVLVIFTDGQFAKPETDPGLPVLWIIHNDPTWRAPFGTVIHYEIR